MFRIDREPMTPLRRRFIDDLRLRHKLSRKVLAGWRSKEENALIGTRPLRRLGRSGILIWRPSLAGILILLVHAKALTQLPTDPSFR